MKEILNRLINQETISKQEAKNVLVNISQGVYNTSQIASFLTVYMMRSISVEELDGFREALLELCRIQIKEAYEPDTGANSCIIAGNDKFNIKKACIRISVCGVFEC